MYGSVEVFFFSSRRRHTRCGRDWSSDVCSSDLQPQRVDVKMTLTALGCPMAAEVMQDVRDHLLQIPGVEDAGVELVYDPPWTPERMSEDARWELGMV